MVVAHRATRKITPTLGKMPGCIFDYYGRIPESVYAPPDTFESPLEEAVFGNDVKRFRKLVEVRAKNMQTKNRG